MANDYDKMADDYPHDAFYLKYVDGPTFFICSVMSRG